VELNPLDNGSGYSKPFGSMVLSSQLQAHRFSGNFLIENVILLLQPPYCPELNPIERLWEHLKANLKWASFQTLEQLQAKVDELLAQLTPEVIASVTGYAFILDALSALNSI
jgi:putative transposase